MTGEARYTIKGAQIAGRRLVVDWADGHRSQFHAVWLRHQCSCETCGTPMNAVRGICLVWLATSDGNINVRWLHGDHQSNYTARWLRDHCYSPAKRASRKHRPNSWGTSIAGDPPIASLADAEASPKARLAMLEAVLEALG